MQILTALLYVLEVVVALLLGLVVMLQKPKDGGLNPAMGGGFGEAVFGAQMGNVLTKTTVVLGIIFLLNTIALSRLTSRASATVMEGVAAEAPVPAETAALPEAAPEVPAPAAQ